MFDNRLFSPFLKKILVLFSTVFSISLTHPFVCLFVLVATSEANTEDARPLLLQLLLYSHQAGMPPCTIWMKAAVLGFPPQTLLILMTQL